MDVHSWHLLFDHLQFALIHWPNIPGSYALLLFTASDFTSITSHIHNWVLFLLWLCLFILSGVISPLIPPCMCGKFLLQLLSCKKGSLYLCGTQLSVPLFVLPIGTLCFSIRANTVYLLVFGSHSSCYLLLYCIMKKDYGNSYISSEIVFLSV